MRASTTLVLVAVAVAIASGAWLFASVHAEARRATAAATSLRKELAEVRAEIGARPPAQDDSVALRAANPALTAALARAGQLPSASPPAIEPDVVDAGGDVPADAPSLLAAQREKLDENVAKLGMKLEERMRDEPFDRAWSRDTVGAVKTAFSEIHASRITEAECRSRTCRVVVEHDSDGDQRALASQIANAAPFDGEVLYRYDFNSTPRKTILYVAREGETIVHLLAGK